MINRSINWLTHSIHRLINDNTTFTMIKASRYSAATLHSVACSCTSVQCKAEHICTGPHSSVVPIAMSPALSGNPSGNQPQPWESHSHTATQSETFLLLYCHCHLQTHFPTQDIWGTGSDLCPSFISNRRMVYGMWNSMFNWRHTLLSC